MFGLGLGLNWTQTQPVKAIILGQLVGERRSLFNSELRSELSILQHSFAGSLSLRSNWRVPATSGGCVSPAIANRSNSVLAFTTPHSDVRQRAGGIGSWPQFTASPIMLLLRLLNLFHDVGTSADIHRADTFALPCHISGVHHFGSDFCVCDSFLIQALR